MKLIFTLLVLFCSAISVLAQGPAKGNAKISGAVMDSVTRKPVEFANVALVNRETGSPIDGAVCDDKGKFEINKVAEGNYNVLVTFIGFETKTFQVNVDKRDNIDLGTIIISPTPQVLKEITVEGQKAIIEERVDRMVYNAENDATAKGGDATDVLKRVPMLSVDMDGNVSLRGNQNILVLINNKPSTIVATSVADALKQIPADQIKTVEVITSPSAKYDAEGSAGIINIITKKNTLEGLTLNIDAGVGIRGSNLGLNGNYRKKKMGFSLGGFGRANYNINGRFENQQTTVDDANNATLNIQSADTRSRGLFGNYNLGWDYDINEKNSLTASVRFGVRNNDNFQDDLRSLRYFNDAFNASTLQNNASDNAFNNVDASLNYTHYYSKPQRELSFQALYSRNNGNTLFENFYVDEADGSITSKFLNDNDSYNQEVTFQADYQTPIGTNQMVEFGGKNIMRKVFSEFSSFQAGADGIYQPSTANGFNNNLNYDQNVTAGYLSYTYSTKSGYSFKAGSRYEYTVINAYTQTDDDIEIPSYGVIVPSLNISRKLKNGNTLKASYNRRIQRPSMRFLNPNIQRNNNLNVTVGNPQLDPEYTNNYELGYSTLLKGIVLNITGFARFTNDGIQSVRVPDEIDGEDVLKTTYENIGQENAYGTSLFANINIGKLSLNGGGDVYYATLDNNNPDPKLRANNEGWVVSGRLFGNYNLNKGWGFQFFSFYRGRQVQLQGTQGGFYMYSLGIRKEFNEKRGSIGVAAENFLQSSMKIRTNLESPVLRQSSLNVMNNTSVRLTFSYRIGKMSMDQRPRRKRSINNDDLKEGDGGGDGAQMGGDGGQQRGGGNMPQMGGGQRPQGMPSQNQNNKPAQPPMEKPADGVVYEAAGTWSYNIDSPQGGTGTIVITKTDGVYSGTIRSERMPKETKVENLVVNGNNISFSYPVNFGGNSATIEVKALINNNDMQGTMAIGQFRTFNLNGKRAN